MIVVSSSEFRDNQKKFFDLAFVQRVFIKRKNQFLELVPRGEVIPDRDIESENISKELKEALSASLNEVKAHIHGDIDLPLAKDIEF